jgi:glycolate dehydrogenase FAD-binding subunit
MDSLSPDPPALGDRAGPAGAVPPELAAACAEVRLASADDLVGGRPARFVAAPASTPEAAAVLRAADALGLSVVLRGAGSRLDWGNPPRSCELIVSTERLDQIVEHAAGDLVATVQAGVPLDAVQSRLASANQRLALDPPGGGTIGGLIATNAAGPLRYRYGAPRDLLIGITVVRADGIVAKAGGKVVKNVAGYDLGKLFAGSYGTLGLITEATFRLHPLPAASAWVAAEALDPASAATLLHAAASSPLSPAAIELDWPATASSLTVSVLLDGDETSVAERADLLASHLASEVDGAVARSFRVSGPRPGNLASPGDTKIRVAFWAGRLASVLGTVAASAASAGLDPYVCGSAAAGVLEVSVSDDAAAESVASFVTDLRAALTGANGDMPVGSVVVLAAPADVRDLVDLWGPVPSLALMRAVKDQFDPGHRLAPGRFAAGI